LANFNPLKRVDRYIQAIVKVSKVHPEYKAALVLASHGEAKKEVLATINRALKSINLTVFSNINQSEINNLFNQSKVNVLVSLREGSNKGLAEGLFSGVPALLIKESAGGNYLHINEQTGRIVPDSKLEDALIWFSEHYVDFNSRDWAMSHIAPTVSAHTLSTALKKVECSAGRQWTTELKPKVNRPELDYLNEEDRWLLSIREELLEVFSVSSTESAILDYLAKLK